MFASLKQFFQENRRPAQDTISSRKKIVAILRHLKEDHELLSVSVVGHPDPANTAVLGVKESINGFYLDELSTLEAHQAFLKQRKAVVQCRLQGVDLRFPCCLVKADSQGGIALYEVAIPKGMVRVQRRQHFRLRLNPGLTVPVTAPHFEGAMVSGEAFDLSAGGLGAFFNTRSLPSRGQVLSGIAISLPGSQPVKANLEVRFARLDSAHHMLRVGGRFRNLDRKQERLLAQFLAEQQRKRRRFNPG